MGRRKGKGKRKRSNAIVENRILEIFRVSLINKPGLRRAGQPPP